MTKSRSSSPGSRPCRCRRGPRWLIALAVSLAAWPVFGQSKEEIPAALPAEVQRSLQAIAGKDIIEHAKILSDPRFRADGRVRRRPRLVGLCVMAGFLSYEPSAVTAG